MKRRGFFRNLFLGILLGAGLTFSPGCTFLLGLVGVMALVLHWSSPLKERRFVVLVFVAGFLVRALFSLGLDLTAWAIQGERPFGLVPSPYSEALMGVDKSRSLFRTGDSDYYATRSYGIALYAKGLRDSYAHGSRYQEYGWNGYLLVSGFFNFLFGFSPVGSKWLNCFWGALVAPLVYFLARFLFPILVARWASLAVAFLPSLIFWSASNLKDSALIALGVLLLLSWARWQLAPPGARRWPWAALFCLGVLLHMGMRSEFYTYALIVCLAVSLWVTRFARKRFTLLLSAVAILVLGWIFRGELKSLFAYALVFHLGHAFTRPGVVYYFLPDFLYDKGNLELISFNFPFLFIAARAVFHFLLEPLPWREGSLMRFLAIPQLSFWYVALPLAFLGAAFSLIQKRRDSLFLFLTMACWTLMGALTNANVGTVFRVRDMVTPFFLIYASAGLWLLLRKGNLQPP